MAIHGVCGNLSCVFFALVEALFFCFLAPFSLYEVLLAMVRYYLNVDKVRNVNSLLSGKFHSVLSFL